MPPVDLPPRHIQYRRHRLNGRLLPFRTAGRCILLCILSLLITFAVVRLHASIASPFASQQQAPWSSPSKEQPAQVPYEVMGSPPADLSSFLREGKRFAVSRLSQPQNGSSSSTTTERPLVLIMGNGAGDADSLTSAISLCYFLTFQSHANLPLASPLPSNAVYVPLVQTKRTDFHLRPENVAMTAAAGLAQEDVLYISDLTDPSSSHGLALDLARSEALSPQRGTYLGLVDHPQLELPWQVDESQQASGSTDSHEQWGRAREVIILIDHHADAGKHKDARLRVFRQPEGTAESDPVGSAQSIVVNLFAEDLARDAAKTPKSLADLAISTVLIDTDNMRPPPKGRASKSDFAAVETLLPLSSLDSAASATNLRTTLLTHSPKEVQDGLANSADAVIDVKAFDPASSAPLADKTAAIADILAASKAAVSHLSGLDLLRRDYKSSALSLEALGPQAQSVFGVNGQALHAGFSSVNLGLPAWLHRGEGHGTESETESTTAWSAYWRTLREWMADQKLDVAVVGTSFHEDEDEGGKHRRELLLAFQKRPTVAEAEAERFFGRLRDELERDVTLLLSTPWKGARLASTGKKERVSGLDKSTGRLLIENDSQPGASAQSTVWAAVWKQGNARANRKVYLPAILDALQKVAKAL
ncbi:unnamed protein product [Parajaminaea phylloscopi]